MVLREEVVGGGVMNSMTPSDCRITKITTKITERKLFLVILINR